MVRKGSKTASGLNSRKRILEATIDLVCEHGFEGTSVNMVCERADIAKTALYWHFKSRTGLMVAAIEELTREWIHDIRAESDPLPNSTPRERQERMLNGFKDLIVNRSDRFRVVWGYILQRRDVDPDMKRVAKELTSETVEAIIQGFRNSLGFDLPDMDLFAHTILALVGEIHRRKLMSPESIDVDRHFEDIDRLIMLMVKDRLKRIKNM
jgi:AcrR family transcriptional regulator